MVSLFSAFALFPIAFCCPSTTQIHLGSMCISMKDYLYSTLNSSCVLVGIHKQEKFTCLFEVLVTKGWSCV